MNASDQKATLRKMKFRVRRVGTGEITSLTSSQHIYFCLILPQKWISQDTIQNKVSIYANEKKKDSKH